MTAPKPERLKQLTRLARTLDRLRARRDRAYATIASCDQAIVVTRAERDEAVVAGQAEGFTYKQMADAIGFTEDGIGKILERRRRGAA